MDKPMEVDSICTVVAIFTPKPEFLDDVRALMRRITPLVHEEAGCEFYALNEGSDGQLIQIEAWTTKQDWIDHMLEPTVRDILAGVEGKLQRDVEVYEMYNIAAGASGKGSIRQGLPTL